MVNQQIEKLLDDIKARAGAHIDKMNLKGNPITQQISRQSLKSLVSVAIAQIPRVVKKQGTQKWILKVLENPRIARSQELQKQIGAAYWAIKVIMQDTAEDRVRQIDKLLKASCFENDAEKRGAISQLIIEKCGDDRKGCDGQQYWKVFTQVAPACWIGLLKEK